MLIPSAALVLVVGPSGAGKDTLIDGARRALAHEPRLRVQRRVVTRAAGGGGEDHISMSEEAFAQALHAGAFCLHWQAHGLHYGIPRSLLDDLAAGRVAVVNASRRVIGDAVALRARTVIAHVTAAPHVLAARLAHRERESAADRAERLARDVPLERHGAACVEIANDGPVEAGLARLTGLLTDLLRATDGASGPGRAHADPPG